MKIQRLTAIYTAISLATLLVGLIIVLLLRAGPVTYSPQSTNSPARSTEQSTYARTREIPGNHMASNANALNRVQGSPSVANPTPVVYPTLAPVAPLSQTVDGYTVTLYPMYADANRVVLTYTVQSLHPIPGKLSMCEPLPGQDPICPPYLPAAGMSPSQVPAKGHYSPQLTSDGGTFQLAPGPLWKDAQLGTLKGSLLRFDSQQSPEQLPSELKLHLTLNTAWMRVPQDDGVTVTREVKGPFTFDFTMPVDPVRRITELNQTLTVDRVHKITITSVMATRRHVRISWRVDYSTWSAPTDTSGPASRNPYGLYACCSLQLEVGGKFATFYRAQGPPVSGSAVADVSALDEQGEWTITVLHNSRWTGGRYDPPLSGPAFHFTLPPAITSLQP